MTKKIYPYLKAWGLPALIVLVVYLISTFVVSVVAISGDSMAPNLLNNQRVVLYHTQNVHRGDVVVFDATKEDPRIKAGENDYVKRVIAVGGDTVVFHDGNIYVNAKKVNQSFLNTEQRTTGTEGMFGSYWSLKTLSSNGLWKSEDANSVKVPKDTYFVLGDNRTVSNDSRYFGFVSKKHVIGRVSVPFWYADSVKKNVNHDSKLFFD